MIVNMNDVVGNDDILFLSLDALRYDVANEAYLEGNLPNLCRVLGWEKRHSPGNYTYAAHHSIFGGFFPTNLEYQKLEKREWLFANKKVGFKQKGDKNTFLYEGSSLVEGLERVGYRTICIGGVIFFSKIGGIYNVLPDMFQESYWNPKFAVTNPKSAREQVDFAINLLKKIDTDQRVFMFINFSAMHAPNYFYLDQYKPKRESEVSLKRNNLADYLDCVESQKAALKYVDQCLAPLFECMKKRNKTFCIALSDHGTCYGEDGFKGHHIGHEVVWTIPYKHFFL